MELMTKEIYFVHAIDAEGPLYESLDAKFERIKNIYNVDIEDKTEKNLIRIKNKEINLNGKETEISHMLSSHLTNYNDNWSKIDNMNDFFLKLGLVLVVGVWLIIATIIISL